MFTAVRKLRAQRQGMIQDLVSHRWESPVAGSHPLARKGKEGSCETLTLEGGRIALGSLAMNTGGASCRPGRLPTGTIGGHKAAGLVWVFGPHVEHHTTHHTKPHHTWHGDVCYGYGLYSHHTPPHNTMATT